jgi:hypothetical protein
MSLSEIASSRLFNQQIIRSSCRTPVEVVAKLGAMQAQDYSGALWSIGLRLTNATEAAIERAISNREIIRTWPMRGTLHFVAAADIRWMLELLTPRVIAGSAYREKRLELHETIFARCRKLFTRALSGDRQLAREAMLDLLEREGISTANNRGYHILWRLAQEGLICFAGRSGKEHTFALLGDWVPESKQLDRETALRELAVRYFTSHGPATVQDFVWWSGLKVSDARAGLESTGSRLNREKIGNVDYWMINQKDLPSAENLHVHLLPGFDEYLLGYTDRSAVLNREHAQKICPGSNGMFKPTVAIDGQVAGTWKKTVKKTSMIISIGSFATLKKAAKPRLIEAADRYGAFLGIPAEMRF